MPRNAAAACALLLGAAASARAARAVGRGRGGGFLSLSSDLQPEAVALTLARVEQDWREQADEFLRCQNTSHAGGAGCEAPNGRFRASCAKIVTAVMQASSGNRNVVRDYLSEVCAQKGLDGWRTEACHSLADAMVSAMSPTAYKNREGMDSAVPCQSFWKGFTSSERVRLEKVLAADQVEEQHRAEAAEKVRQASKEAADAEAEAKRRGEAEAAAEREAEAQRQAEEAARRAEQQRARMAEAESRLSAQAEDVERNASQGMAEAQAAIDAATRRPTQTAEGSGATSGSMPPGGATGKTVGTAPNISAQPAVKANATGETAAPGANATRTF